jgi:hypothetical protein
MSKDTRLFPNLLANCDGQLLDVFGPTIQIVSAPQAEDEAPCVLKGVIPPGISVPMHSHPGVEAFSFFRVKWRRSATRVERLTG